MLTDRFAEALVYAEGLHRSQTRKGNSIPYAAHLLAVCSFVLEAGGDENTAIAALLHDAVEDQGGSETLAEIRRRFGDQVAEVVLACSDSMTADKKSKAPWRERKEAHIRKLRTASPEVCLVTLGDKLHNISALIRDVRRDGPGTMARFNAGSDEIVWYYAQVADALTPQGAIMPVDDLQGAVETLARFLRTPTSQRVPATEPSTIEVAAGSQFDA